MKIENPSVETIKKLIEQNEATLRGERLAPFADPYDGKTRMTREQLIEQSAALRARLETPAARVTRVARAICRETCAYMGEPACFDVRDDQGRDLPWPAPSCDEPGCIALAEAALAALDRGP